MANRMLKQKNSTIPKWIVLSFVAVVLGGSVLSALALAYIWFSGGDGSASVPIAAPHLSVQPDDPRVLLRIDPEQSEASFRIDETLLGKPKTVIGTTRQVAGEMLIDVDNPANSQVGLIRINVRTLTTDNEFRNRALRGQILEADQDEYEFADFIVTNITGLPDYITIGETMDIQITGDLVVHGVRQSIVFDATITMNSEAELQGIASATVRHTDFDITIPEASGVADVSDVLQLTIDFMAVAIQDT